MLEEPGGNVRCVPLFHGYLDEPDFEIWSLSSLPCIQHCSLALHNWHCEMKFCGPDWLGDLPHTRAKDLTLNIPVVDYLDVHNGLVKIVKSRGMLH